MKSLLFLLIPLSILAGLHVLLWYRLFRAPAWGGVWPSVGAGLLGLLAMAVVLAMSLVWKGWLAPAPAAVLSTVAFVWMGMLLLLTTTLLGSEVLRGGVWLVSTLASHPLDPLRMARGTALLALTSGLILSGVALVGGHRHTVKTVEVPIANLPASLQGFTIVQLTDLHASAITRRPWIASIVAETNALHPDLVAITGDLVDGEVARLAHEVEPLSGLKAPQGVYFTTGNHEYYSGAVAWTRHLPSLGLRVLQNERVSLPELPLDILGIPDPSAAHSPYSFPEGNGPVPDLARTVEGRDPTRVAVLLAHQPLQSPPAAALGLDLVLTGHTHGGQIWPFTYAVPLQQPFVTGLHKLGEKTWLYISNGAGTWGPPMRLFAPAEITKLVLTRA